MRPVKKSIVVRTPLGFAGVGASEKGISSIVLPKKDRKAVEQELNIAECGVRSAERSLASNRNVLKKTVMLLQQYFSGRRVSFDLPLDMPYYTAFQRAVWKAAAEIPFGETRSYGWIAKRIGNPKAARAVGQAMGANPVPIIIP
jgi:methylated-DNA-[protein]-cysteine S-methyltransferase